MKIVKLLWCSRTVSTVVSRAGIPSSSNLKVMISVVNRSSPIGPTPALRITVALVSIPQHTVTSTLTKQFHPIAITFSTLVLSEYEILSQFYLLLVNPNDSSKFPYKLSKFTLDVVFSLWHLVSKGLNNFTKSVRYIFVDYSSAFSSVFLSRISRFFAGVVWWITFLIKLKKLKLLITYSVPDLTLLLSFKKPFFLPYPSTTYSGPFCNDPEMRLILYIPGQFQSVIFGVPSLSLALSEQPRQVRTFGCLSD